MERSVAILGAGIMGCSTALYLARAGIGVTLFDQAPNPFRGASRWNEGKIHLGFLYAGDPSFRTADRVLPGGLSFKPLVEELIGSELRNCTRDDDIYLVHQDSVSGVEATRSYFERLCLRISEYDDTRHYLTNLTDSRTAQLSDSELSDVACSDDIVAGFRVPERSVSTNWLADQFVEALAGTPEIALRMNSRVTALRHTGSGKRKQILVCLENGNSQDFDTVVNCMWEGRAAGDQSLGMNVPHPISHRYRVSLFVKTDQPVRCPSAVICTGPFGDVKNYTDQEFYLSWYQTGLLAEGNEVHPPVVLSRSGEDRSRLVDKTFDALSSYLVGVGPIRNRAADIRVEGGWVFAQGDGDLGNPRSSLHRRDRVGITSVDNYYSVDTGKYSIAPWLARNVAAQIAGPLAPRHFSLPAGDVRS